MEQNRLNAYHIMWLFVFFDLPVTLKKERKAAARFRKDLMNDGFGMMQFSVYTRHCASKESSEVHVKRVKGNIPEKGQVSILQVTDKQYGEIINVWGRKSVPLAEGPKQLELF
ncbi:MAG: CRISPR-associated endonuclease Cas2 [Bacteroidales bacterium]|nr:CRISPR-associated endonuclease Cas2 [Bacteroidales bacterium]